MGVIAISAQVGSYGEEIADLVAQQLNYRVVSRKHLHQLAMECDAEFKDACSAFEEEKGPGLIERFFFNEPANTSLFESLNFELAAEGDVVILGRGAQIALAAIPGVLKVRVVAPPELRVRRVMETEGVSLEEAASVVHHVDKRRSSLVESVFHRDPSDWSLYDLVVNTAFLSRTGAADIIYHAAGHLKEPQDKEALKKRLENLSVAKKIESHLKKHIFTTTYRDILVELSPEGVVTLTGSVPDTRQKERAEELAMDIPGVTRVVNKLGTTQLSFG